MRIFSCYLLIVSGFLFNFSVLNIGNSGLPFFWVATYFSLFFNIRYFIFLDKRLKHLFYAFFVLFIAACFHIITGNNAESNLFQLISRVNLLIYCFTLFLLLTKCDDLEIRKLSKLICYLLFLTLFLGTYEWWAITSGAPIIQYYFANNPSFSQAVVGVENGWSQAYRVRGFWGEASYSALFILYAFIAIFTINKITTKRFLFFLTVFWIGFYSFTTYSRVVWITYVCSILLLVLYKPVKKIILATPKVFLFILVFTALH